MAPNRAAYPSAWSLGSQPVVTAPLMRFLDIVRDVAPEAGLTPFDPVDTCELLALDRHTTLRSYATALGLSLDEALGLPPVMGHPGTSELTFDEAWLLRLVDRSQHVDAESVAFLICSRVRPDLRPSIAFLLEGVVGRL